MAKETIMVLVPMHKKVSMKSIARRKKRQVV